MATRQYTEADVQQMTEADPILREAGVNMDLATADGRRNGDAIIKFFDEHPEVPVTVGTICGLVSERRDMFAFISPAQQEYNRLVAEDPARAEELEKWFSIQKDLVKDGDDGLENRSTLLNELHGRPINHLTIYEAINRVQHSGTSRFNPRRRPLVFVPSAPRRDPRSHATTTDATGTYKPGRLFDRTEVNKSPADYRAERARAEAEADRVMNPDKYRNTTSTVQQPDAWQTIAKSLLDSAPPYHSQREALQAQYDRGAKREVSWREAASAMQQLANSFKRLIPTAKF